MAPDLADLDAFAAVARAGGFRSAAALRGVSASSLSEALRRLEARLGVRLINRTTRSVTLTEAGARLFERLTLALGEVGAALDAVNSFRDSPVGTLRLNVPTVVARIVLPPLVARFLAAHPGIVLEVTAEDTFIDVLAAGFDAGVRYDERLQRDMIAVPIGPRTQRYVVAASPAYLARRGRPIHPRDLLEHACIRHRFASGVALSWEFERDGEVIRVVPHGPLVANSGELEVAAAVDGLGIVCTFEGFIAAELASGALEPVLESWLPPFSGPFLYYHSRRQMPGPLRAFVDFLKREQRA
jgi:DNA-binding transcriptional LysR family regulator